MKKVKFTFYLWLLSCLFAAFLSHEAKDFSIVSMALALLCGICGAGAMQDYTKANKK